MSRPLRCFVATICILIGPRLSAQQQPTSAPATIAVNPRDVASVDAIIDALYDANTNLVDQKRGADRFRSLFAPGARLVPTAGRPNAKATLSVLSVEDYVKLASSGQPRHGFSEREIARTADGFGRIMQVFSTYEARRDSSDQKPTRGINSIQLFNDGSRWWVVTVFWDTERVDNPIPASYLKTRAGPPR